MISLKNVTKIYNQNSSSEVISVDSINLSISKGSFTILSGVSGSGKSTLLSIIGALNRPTFGEVKVFGELISKLPDFHASKFRLNRVGFIFQSFNLFENLTTFENVSLALIPLKISNSKVEDLVDRAIERVGLLERRDSIVSNLSGGERQRVTIARALVNQPDLILADEPTANLDRGNSELFIQTLKSLKSEGKTIILATHDEVFLSLKSVDRVVKLEKGRVV